MSKVIPLDSKNCVYMFKKRIDMVIYGCLSGFDLMNFEQSNEIEVLRKKGLSSETVNKNATICYVSSSNSSCDNVSVYFLVQFGRI